MAKKQRSNLQKLLKTYDSEARSGSRANNRFSFQETWSLIRLLEVHTSTSNYIAVFDLFDDFVIFEDATSYGEASFFQIKSKDSSQWALTDLTATRKNSSILSKVFAAFKKFKGIIKKSHIVVNGSFSLNKTITLNADSETRIIDFDLTERSKIYSKLCLSEKSKIGKDFCQAVHIVVSDLPLDEKQRDLILKGKLTEFIDSHFPGKPYQIKPIVECLKAEISVRSKFEKEIPNEYTLKEKKALTKEQISNFITHGIQMTESDDWKIVKNTLQLEGGSLNMIKKLSDGYTDLSTSRTFGSATLDNITKQARIFIEEEESHQSKLMDLVSAVYSKIVNIEGASIYSEHLLKAMIAYEYQTKR